MKKYLILIMISIVSFFGVKDVKADTYTFNYSFQGESNPSQSRFNLLKSNISEDREIIRNLYDELYSYYLENYKDVYPFYYILFSISETDVSYHNYNMSLVYHNFDTVYISYSAYINSGLKYGSTLDSNFNSISLGAGSLSYSYSDGAYSSFITESDVTMSSPGYYILSNASGYFSIAFGFFYSNIPFTYYSSNSEDKLVINNYALSGNSKTINVGEHIPLLQEDLGLDIINDYNSSDTSYVEIDLNKYPYVALSLKDYNVDPFDTVMYVKGQLCPTPVYNYGMNTKDSFQNNVQVSDRCNIAYDDFTPTKFYILDRDLKNHSIYYLKAYDTSIENKIKVDSSIFNIHYITEEEKDNPILNINGKNYTTLPYDELPSTATKNEADNYVPGANEEFTFTDFFDKPLDALKSVWGAITSVFAIITEFILLLPPTMQGFLYTSFGIAIVLGIIKILL